MASTREWPSSQTFCFLGRCANRNHLLQRICARFFSHFARLKVQNILSMPCPRPWLRERKLRREVTLRVTQKVLVCLPWLNLVTAKEQPKTKKKKRRENQRERKRKEKESDGEKREKRMVDRTVQWLLWTMSEMGPQESSKSPMTGTTSAPGFNGVRPVDENDVILNSQCSQDYHCATLTTSMRFGPKGVGDCDRLLVFSEAWTKALVPAMFHMGTWCVGFLKPLKLSWCSLA